MTHSPEQLLTLIACVCTAILSFLAYRKACEACDHACCAADVAENLADHPALAVPERGAPGVSLPQVLRFWDLLSKIIGYWAGFKGLDHATIPLIKTKIDGRHCKIGPTPVEFTD